MISVELVKKLVAEVNVWIIFRIRCTIIESTDNMVAYCINKGKGNLYWSKMQVYVMFFNIRTFFNIGTYD